MIQAVIFDMDGVISDTDHLHFSIEMKILKDNGVILNVEEFKQNCSHRPFRSIAYSTFGKNEKAEHIIKEKWDEMVLNKNISPISGVKDLIARLNGTCKLGLATGSSVRYTEHILSLFDLKGAFLVTSGIEDTEKPKPDPDVFLFTAKKLGVLPACCLVIENSVGGVKAAKAAGMKCIAYQDPRVEKRDFSEADLVVSDFNELDVEKIISL